MQITEIVVQRREIGKQGSELEINKLPATIVLCTFDEFEKINISRLLGMHEFPS
jgi:hypothetical protein